MSIHDGGPGDSLPHFANCHHQERVCESRLAAILLSMVLLSCRREVSNQIENLLICQIRENAFWHHGQLRALSRLDIRFTDQYRILSHKSERESALVFRGDITYISPAVTGCHHHDLIIVLYFGAGAQNITEQVVDIGAVRAGDVRIQDASATVHLVADPALALIHLSSFTCVG